MQIRIRDPACSTILISLRIWIKVFLPPCGAESGFRLCHLLLHFCQEKKASNNRLSFVCVAVADKQLYIDKNIADLGSNTKPKF
jgi:hypothetical protein